MRLFVSFIAAVSFASCQPEAANEPSVERSTPPAEASVSPANRLASILDAQPDTVRARYVYRRPLETVEFFGIEPGMTVMEALPDGGWYSKILLPYLGAEGRLIGADYAYDMYPKFGFYDDEFLQAKKTWIDNWTAEAESWRSDDSATVAAFVMGTMPAELEGTADAVLFIRALHNLNNYENDGGFMTSALQNAFDILKPGGIVGVVQHQSTEEMPDDWANGANGYLKKSHVISVLEAAGFEYVAETAINQNARDLPGTDEYVWRLPPSYDGADDKPELRAAVDEIGESNRMTLRFQKPAN